MKEKKKGIFTKPISTMKAAIAIVVCIVIVVGVVIGNFYAARYSKLISVYLDTPTQKIVSGENEETQYFKTDFSSEEEKQEHFKKIGIQLEEEGIVLLKNEEDALPLSQSAKVTMLGVGSADPVYSGGGAAAINTSSAIDLKTAFGNAGLELNPVMIEFYEEGVGVEYKRAEADAMNGNANVVNEVPVEKYTENEMTSFSDYQDAAIVVIGRAGSEQFDHSAVSGENGYTYLQLDDNEKELLKMADDNFDKVIVLLNTSNPIELGPLEDYDIDACLWIGAIGTTGAEAVGEVLTGEVNPSGRLVDTYAYDSLSAPAMANFGDYKLTNTDTQFANTYMVYGEGIYVGYHYYETRYEDVVLGNEDNVNYEYTSSVRYPFGYGLSYTNFEWSGYEMKENDESIDISVTVKNTGETPGKEVVQIYMQSPYTDYDKENKIEKSAVELKGYAKTQLLESGKEETVTISIPKEEMKTYDANGHETYILDAGDYYFAAGRNSHDALNNILAAKGMTVSDGMDAEGNADMVHKITVNDLDADTYAVSAETGSQIENQFEDADINFYDEEYTYLSRSDWEGTWPTTYMDGQWEAPEELLKNLEISYAEDEDANPVTGVTNEELGELSVASLIGMKVEDEAWDALIQQMSVEELDKLVRIGGYATQNVDSIQLPATVDKDGTAGITAGLVGGKDGAAYPTEIVIASTWNQELAEEFGECIGEDSIELGVSVWYAPACNIHRAPYSGRNFEYFSEDSFLSGAMTRSIVAGAQSKGVIPTVKHFAVNDQEQNRMGGAMFVNEQSIRELYLKPFEMAVRDADAMAMMASMNRIGARWTGGHTGLITNTLREEWGFDGFVVTDQASYDVFAYEDMREGLEAGTDLWLNTDATLWKLSDEEMTPTVVSNMQRAAKNIVYTISKSNAMNGLSSGSKVIKIIPIWQKALIVLDVVIGIFAVFVLSVVISRLINRRKNTIRIEK